MSTAAQNIDTTKKRLFQIPDSELDFKFSRSSGPGGQNVNKTSSKASLRWNPFLSEVLSSEQISRLKKSYPNLITSEGFILISSDRYRDQPRNIEDTKEKLDQIIESIWFAPKQRKKTKPSRGSIQARITEKKNRGATKKSRQRIDY